MLWLKDHPGWKTQIIYLANGHKHKSDVNTGKDTATKLSTHLCSLKEKNIPYDVDWGIVTRASTYNPTTRICRLCLTEAYHIIFTPGGASLNRRDELFGYCRHKKTNLISKIKID